MIESRGVEDIKVGQVDKELVLQNNGRYFEWIKGFKKAASLMGVLGFFGFSGAVEVYRPTIHQDIRDRVEQGLELDSKELSSWNKYNGQMREYEKQCGKCLGLIESYVSREIFDKIQTQVSGWDTPSHVKLKKIVEFLKESHGGTYAAFRDSANMRAMEAIPYFGDYRSAMVNITKMKQLLQEREMWDANRTVAQVNANVSYIPSKAMLNNWLSERLMSENASAMSLRTTIDLGVDSYETNVTKVITMFEKIENDKKRDAEMKTRHGGATNATTSWNMSFVAREEQEVRVGGGAVTRTEDVCTTCRNLGHKSEVCKADRASLPLCYACGGRGHFKRECANLLAWPAENKSKAINNRPGYVAASGQKRAFQGGVVNRYTPSVRKSTPGMITIRNSDGSPRDKILKRDFRAYRCHLDETVELSREYGTEDDDDESVVLTVEEEACNYEAKRQVGAQDQSM
jgi:hypothetical protein